ncbi:MAG TPA: class I SAM-dependent methyltransferase [Candidatus Krumholzibacteria bacterium]
MDSISENARARKEYAPPASRVRSLPRKVRNRVRRVLRWLGLRPSARQYWQTRALTHGVRSVLDLRHTDTEVDEVTARQVALLFPLLRGCLGPDDRRLLDFGCGPGRFTPLLANLVGGTAVGVDPVERYVDMAPRAPNVEYRALRRGIDAADGSFDVVWICVVLGGIVGRRELKRTAREIERVLRPGGLLFLVENTSETRDGYYWKYRSVDDYRRLFPSVALAPVSEYVDIDQRISVLAGRRRAARVS